MTFLTGTCDVVGRSTKNFKLINICRELSIWRGCSRLDERREKELQIKRNDIMSRGLPKQKPIKGVKQILVVASGKGGVGKSTTAVNLSTALKIIEPKKSIGLLDTDVFGPSIPLMMNLQESPLLNKFDFMVPPINYGVQCMSMGFLIDEKSSVVWRGLMVMSAIEKLLYKVAWAPVDYLIVDTPPGTGDTHLSLLQNLPIAGALLVTTPQKAALEVTRRGATIFQKLNVPIVGIVENMSSITCPKCASEISLFGNGTDSIAMELGTTIHQRIPLCDELIESGNTGKPIVLSAPNSAPAQAYRNLARTVITFLRERPVNQG